MKIGGTVHPQDYSRPLAPTAILGTKFTFSWQTEKMNLVTHRKTFQKCVAGTVLRILRSKLPASVTIIYEENDEIFGGFADSEPNASYQL